MASLPSSRIVTVTLCWGIILEWCLLEKIENHLQMKLPFFAYLLSRHGQKQTLMKCTNNGFLNTVWFVRSWSHTLRMRRPLHR